MPDPEEIPIDQLIEASSFGTPEARAARATVSDEHAASLVARSTGHPEETDWEALAKLFDHEPDWTTARNGQPMSCSCGGQIPEPTWGAVWLHRADAILAARRLSESGGVDLDGFHDALLDELANANVISVRVEDDTEEWVDEMPSDDLLMMAENALTRTVLLSESEIRRDQAKKDAGMVDDYARGLPPWFYEQWHSGKDPAHQDIAADIRAQFTPSPETEQEP